MSSCSQMFVNLAQLTQKALLGYSVVLHTLSQRTFRAVFLGGQGSCFQILEISKHLKKLKRMMQTAQSLPGPLSGQHPGLTGGGLPRLWSTSLVLQAFLSPEGGQPQLLCPWLSK